GRRPRETPVRSAISPWSTQRNKCHVHAAVAAVAAVAEEPVGLALRARRPVVDVLGRDARPLEDGARRDPQIDVVLLRALHHHAGHVAEGGAELLDDLGADLETLGP